MSKHLHSIIARLTGKSATDATPDAFDRLHRMVEAERRRAGRHTPLLAR